MEDMEITKEIRDKYLKSPMHCPFCGGGNIDTDPIEASDDSTTQIVICLSCNMVWKDIYTLTNIDNAFLNDET